MMTMKRVCIQICLAVALKMAGMGHDEQHDEISDRGGGGTGLQRGEVTLQGVSKEVAGLVDRLS